jgi:hypothetical protein
MPGKRACPVRREAARKRTCTSGTSPRGPPYPECQGPDRPGPGTGHRLDLLAPVEPDQHDRLRAAGHHDQPGTRRNHPERAGRARCGELPRTGETPAPFHASPPPAGHRSRSCPALVLVAATSPTSGSGLSSAVERGDGGLHHMIFAAEPNDLQLPYQCRSGPISLDLWPLLHRALLYQQPIQQPPSPLLQPRTESMKPTADELHEPLCLAQVPDESRQGEYGKKAVLTG